MIVEQNHYQFHFYFVQSYLAIILNEKNLSLIIEQD